jgi:CheY-like chemotaxis protein
MGLFFFACQERTPMQGGSLSLREAAKRAGLSEEDLRCAIEGGLLPAEYQQNVGTFVIRENHLEAYLKAINHKQAPPQTRKVLIIDDEINFGNLLKMDLQRDSRIHAKFATWGKDGLTLARTFQPDLILLDFMLPDVTGEEILRGLQECCQKKGAKILVYSAHTREAVQNNPGLRERLAVLGVDAIIDKTQGLKALTKRVYEEIGFQATTAILKARPMISPGS